MKMKGLIAAIALALGSTAVSAETVTLGPSVCGGVKQCIDIPNDEQGLTVSLYGAPGYPWFYFYVNGVPYKANQPSGYAGTNVLLADEAGDVIYLTYSFSTYVTCNHVGRGQGCTTHWTLNSGGSLVR